MFIPLPLCPHPSFCFSQLPPLADFPSLKWMWQREIHRDPRREIGSHLHCALLKIHKGSTVNAHACLDVWVWVRGYLKPHMCLCRCWHEALNVFLSLLFADISSWHQSLSVILIRAQIPLTVNTDMPTHTLTLTLRHTLISPVSSMWELDAVDFILQKSDPNMKRALQPVCKKKKQCLYFKHTHTHRLHSQCATPARLSSLADLHQSSKLW